MSYLVLGKKIDSNLFPDFLCIGAQKAGTSWLYAMLRLNDKIFIPKERYIHFFDRNFHSSMTGYLENFKAGKSKLKGEVIPGYGLIPKSRIRFIRKMNPELKVILILRDPIERAWSHAKMALTAGGKEITEISDEEFIRHFRSNLSVSKGDYETIYKNWKSVFPEEQIHFIFNEDIQNEPANTLSEVFRFLGIEKETDFEKYNLKKRINKGFEKSIPKNLRNELTKIYGAKMRKYPDLFGERTLNWIKKYHTGE